MNRNLGNSKDILKYLEKRYHTFHNQSFDDDLLFIQDLANHHTSKQLSMMKRRIDTSILEKKDSFAVSINPITLLPVFLTIFCSVIIGFTSNVPQSLHTVIEMITIMSIFTTIGLSYLWISLSRRILKSHKCSILLEESIELKETEHSNNGIHPSI